MPRQGEYGVYMVKGRDVRKSASRTVGEELLE